MLTHRLRSTPVYSRPGLTRRVRLRGWLWLAGPLVCLGLGGCNFPGVSTSLHLAAHAATTDTDTSDSGPVAANSDATMVSAVNPNDSAGSPISVKFRIEARPMVGSPVKIMVTVIPSADAQINHVHGAFLTGDGLTLRSDRSFDAGELRAGSPLYRELTVVPMQTGVLSLSATIVLDMEKSSQSRSYSIPLIATDSSS